MICGLLGFSDYRHRSVDFLKSLTENEVAKRREKDRQFTTYRAPCGNRLSDPQNLGNR
jgi:hypothetical protein